MTVSLSNRDLALLKLAMQATIDKVEVNWEHLKFYTDEDDEPDEVEIQDLADRIDDKLIGN